MTRHLCMCIDPGIRNMAYIVFDEETGAVLRWELLGLLGRKRKVAELSTEEIIENTIRTFAGESLSFERESMGRGDPRPVSLRVFVEGQMSSKMKTVQTAAFSAFYLDERCSEVHLLAPMLVKRKFGLSFGSHGENKKRAVSGMLSSGFFQRDASLLPRGGKSKLDDLADVWWMMRYVRQIPSNFLPQSLDEGPPRTEPPTK